MKTRTIVLALAAISVAALGGVVYALVAGGDERRVGAISQSYSSARTLLLLDGQPAGFLASAKCGGAGAEVTRVNEGRTGPDPKQIGGARYEPCQLAFGLSMGQEVYGWISEAMAGKVGPRNLSLQVLDYENKERRRIELQQALLTEFSMPTFDAASSDQARMTIKVETEKLSVAPGSGEVVGTASAQQKSWLAATFKFELGGQPLAGISKVSSFGFEMPPGTQRPLFGNFTLTVTDVESSALEKMLRSFVLDGQNAPENEMKARVTMLSANLADTLATLDLNGVGMVGGELAAPFTAGSDATPRRTFTLYAEGASLNIVRPAA